MKIKNLVASIIPFIFTQSLVCKGDEKFSQKLEAKVMSYHSQHKDFTSFGYVRPTPSKNWLFEKDDFTQYLVNLLYMVEGVYEAIEKFSNQKILSEEDASTLWSIIDQRSLGDAIRQDLEAEHLGYYRLSPIEEANLYRDHLFDPAWSKDPIYVLISVYTIVFGHAFGAKSFLSRASELDFGKSVSSKAYPSNRDKMKEDLFAMMDRLATKSNTSSYLKYLTIEFVLQGSALRVLDKSMPQFDKRNFLQKSVSLQSGLSFPPWHKGWLAGPYSFWWMNLTMDLVEW